MTESRAPILVTSRRRPGRIAYRWKPLVQFLNQPLRFVNVLAHGSHAEPVVSVRGAVARGMSDQVFGLGHRLRYFVDMLIE
ncbi:hypothetical protein [Mycobacteroides salmoniphilum]|uniref:hypothetical protein n=1 Tax=Mycobacteroides salmoniphilum TaxID=404941 RepID=UPI00177B8371|nr:hypothetical protein [Mycobacteroides salmoniphilum]